MVMKAMLIGLLVIGAVAMLETDAYARHCGNWLCIEFTPEELEKVLAEVKKHQGSEVRLIGFTDRVGNSFDRVSHQMEYVRETLIQHGLQPDIFRWLILEDYAPLDPERRGIKVIVAWPPSEKYTR
jgi:hypothetical protein